MIKRMALAAPIPRRMQQRRVAIPLCNGPLFTETPRWIDFVDRDPLALREITVRFAQADRRLTRLVRQGAAHIHMPTLLMLGGRDRIVENRSCRDYLGRTSATEKTLIEYPNAAHTLEFEPDPTRYFADLADWIGRTTAK